MSFSSRNSQWSLSLSLALFKWFNFKLQEQNILVAHLLLAIYQEISHSKVSEKKRESVTWQCWLRNQSCFCFVLWFSISLYYFDFCLQPWKLVVSWMESQTVNKSDITWKSILRISRISSSFLSQNYEYMHSLSKYFYRKHIFQYLWMN